MADKKCLRLKAGFKGSRLLLIFLSMFILAIPVLAKKDKTKKKVVQVDKGLEPDAVCHKANLVLWILLLWHISPQVVL